MAKSQLFLAFISRTTCQRACRKERKAWINTEIAKHIRSGGAAPIYFVGVPGFVGEVAGLREQAMLGDQRVPRWVAELCQLAEAPDAFIGAAALVVGQIRDRRQITTSFVHPFLEHGIDALRPGNSLSRAEATEQVRSLGAEFEMPPS